MGTHLLVTARAVEAFIGNTFGLKNYPKYTIRVTEMLKKYTVGRQHDKATQLFGIPSTGTRGTVSAQLADGSTS